MRAEIWAGSDTGLIHLTRDGGKTWTNVTPTGLTPWSKITYIEASHFTAGEAYAAVDRHRLDDMRPHLFRTRDFGKSWAPIVAGIGPTCFLNAVREDPQRKGLLFAGTEFGVYVSFDDGDHWQSLQLNLPVSSVRDLVIHDNDLVIATHGRSFWILDDIAPLRQIESAVADTEARLYKPAPAVRITNDFFPGTPLPPEEPQARNPPKGAYLDYYLPNAVDEVTLEIADASGNLVRRFSSRDTVSVRTANLPIAPRWLPQPARLSNAAGMHRFIWDLHYVAPGETGGPGLDVEGNPTASGPLVLPGNYTVKLHAGDRDLVQGLEVAMDPRTRASHEDLVQQYEWARKAYDDMLRGRKAAAEIAAFQIQLTKAKVGVTDRALLGKMDAANRESGTILTGGTEQSGQGLRSAISGFSAVLSALESADRTPPSQVIAAYKDASAILEARLKDWADLKRKTGRILSAPKQP